jgi:hypothetical protein
MIVVEESVALGIPDPVSYVMKHPVVEETPVAERRISRSRLQVKKHPAGIYAFWIVPVGARLQNIEPDNKHELPIRVIARVGGIPTAFHWRRPSVGWS